MHELQQAQEIIRKHPGIAAVGAAGGAVLLYLHLRGSQAGSSAGSGVLTPVPVNTAGGGGGLDTSSLPTDTSTPAAPAGTPYGATYGGVGSAAGLPTQGYFAQVPGLPAPVPYSDYPLSSADTANVAIGGGLKGAALGATISSANTIPDACNPTKCRGILGCIGNFFSTAVTCVGRVAQTAAVGGISAGLIGGQVASSIPGIGLAGSVLGDIGKIGATASPSVGYGATAPTAYNPYAGVQGYGGFTPPISPYYNTGVMGGVQGYYGVPNPAQPQYNPYASATLAQVVQQPVVSAPPTIQRTPDTENAATALYNGD